MSVLIKVETSNSSPLVVLVLERGKCSPCKQQADSSTIIDQVWSLAAECTLFPQLELLFACES